MPYPTTTNLGLSKPPDGDTAWGPAMRDNLDVLDGIASIERQVATVTPSLAFYETALLEVDLSQAADLTVLTTDHPAWVRICGSASARIEDLARPITQKVTDGRGVYGDAITYQPDGLTLFWSEVPTFQNNDTPRTGTAYLAVTNMEPGYSGPIALVLTYRERGPRTGAMQGLAGLDGRTILYGPRDPLAADGKDGDAWFNTATWSIFAPRAAGAWPAGVSLMGPQGVPGAPGANGSNGLDGNTILYGDVDPTAADGVDGNFFINKATWFIFGPKAAGSWPAGTSLVGPAGGGGGITYTYWDPDAPPASPSSLDDEFDGAGLDAKWTLVNTPTSYSVNGTIPGALSVENVSLTNTLPCFMQSLPVGDFCIVTKFAISNGATSANSGCGLILSDGLSTSSSNQATLFFQKYSSNSDYCASYTWTKFNTIGSNLGSRYQSATRYLRIRRSGTSYYWGASPDGKTWEEWAYNPTFTPTHVGLMTYCNQSSPVMTSFEFFRYFSSATATIGRARSASIQ